jgi:putative nucleotidyltransferase with HDIG domain
MNLAATRATSVMEALAQEVDRRGAELPVLPRNAAETLRMARAPDMDFGQVVRVAEADPTLAAKILSVANSALYARGGPVAALRPAAVRLGVQALRDLLYMSVYGAALFDAARYGAMVEGVFAHSVRVAASARRLARRANLDAETAYLAGLLHDVGRARCLKLAAKRFPPSVDEAELAAAVDALHTRAGVAVARAWKLPEVIASVCALHHDPDEQPMVRVVRAADLLTHHAQRTKPVDETALRLALLGADVPADLHAEVMARAVEDDIAMAQAS